VFLRGNVVTLDGEADEVALGETVVVGPGRLADVGAPAVRTLTRREVSVLQLVGEDLTSQQIASRMGVSIRTVHAHLQNAYRKLGVGSRRELEGALGGLGASRP
jgi:DNA-binding CsgD family transcriptional regulator